MKKIDKILLLVSSLIFIVFTGCEDNILDKAPRDIISEKTLWNDIDMIDQFVVSTYNSLDDWCVTVHNEPNINHSLAILTSDAVYRDASDAWSEGEVSPADLLDFSFLWAEKYNYIRNINIFFNQIDELEVNVADQKRVNNLKGEMKFLRANYYSDLIKYFGGVPLITKVFTLNDELNNEKRDSYQEVVDFIVRELDEAQEMLPVTREQWGRINKGACMALKSEVLLYAASKLHDPSTEPRGPLFDYDKNNKWQEASDAAKAIIDMNQYSLVEVDTWQEYNEKIFSGNNSEIILAKPKSSVYQTLSRTLDFVNRPNGYNGWGANTPTHQHICAYEMANGKMIDEPGSGYNPSPDSIYENREMRFYANILFQGAYYRGRETEYYTPGGRDSKDGPNATNRSWTGYNTRKFMNESIDPDKGDFSTWPWPIFRLAEIYLIYAEAQFLLGHEDVAREYINKIRSLVNLHDIRTSVEALI